MEAEPDPEDANEIMMMESELGEVEGFHLMAALHEEAVRPLLQEKIYPASQTQNKRVQLLYLRTGIQLPSSRVLCLMQVQLEYQQLGTNKY